MTLQQFLSQPKIEDLETTPIDFYEPMLVEYLAEQVH